MTKMGKPGWMGTSNVGDYGPYEHDADVPDGLWESCETCGGEGVYGHDCGEDTCCCRYPEENLRCQICDGTGGWYIGVDGKPIPQAPKNTK